MFERVTILFIMILAGFLINSEINNFWKPAQKYLDKKNKTYNISPTTLENIPLLKITYTNYKGSTGVRNIVPLEIWYGCTSFHPDEQYMLRAYDIDKQGYRDFDVKDIKWNG